MCPSQMTSTTTTTAKVTFSNKDSRAQSKLLQEAVANKQKEKNHQKFRTKKNEDSHDFIMSSLSTWMERIKTSCQTSASSSSSSSSSNINNALAESATSLDYASTTTNNNSSEFFATTTNNNNENNNNCLNDLNRVYQHMPNEWKEVLLHEDQEEETSESSTTHHEEDHLAEEFLIRDAAAYPRASEMLDPKEMIGLVL